MSGFGSGRVSSPIGITIKRSAERDEALARNGLDPRRTFACTPEELRHLEALSPADRGKWIRALQARARHRYGPPA